MARLLRYWIKQLISLKNIIVIVLMGLIINSAWSTELLNVSYDPTRELYKDYNAAFIQYWQEQSGEKLTIKNSHGGSGKQARSVIDGLQADVVTLALAGDIDALNRYQSILDENWQTKLPNNSTPYTSTIVFLVRKGNPQNIHDWNDLIKEGVEVITPNPKTSGGARWNFLAAWVYAKELYGSDDKALQFVTDIYRHAPVLDTGARGATISFVQRELGDVLLTWENEAHLALIEQGDDKLEIIIPSISILAEPPVAVVDSVVDKKGTRKQAEAYLHYLYSDKAQHIIAKNYYRPTNPIILSQYATQFPELKLVTVDEYFGGWSTIQRKFFNDGTIFDTIFAEINN
ncbi:sulfate ABC transporter substrate-binding protein [Orbus mooreae]